MNANDYFSNTYGDARPFSNANQWNDSLGGPILKNRLFFFVDNEGIRFLLPNVDTVTVPTPAFANAVLANVSALHPAESSDYQKMFNLWTATPGSGNAQVLPNSAACNSLTLPGFNPATQACAQRFITTPNALASEWILAFKIDYRLGDKDNAYYRYHQDHGVQPTTLDAVSPNFDAISNQPSYDNQFNETHVFGPHSTNSFMATFSHYVAQFAQNPSLVSSTFPVSIITSGTVPFTSFNAAYDFPQGRNITQYQFIDDYTLNIGRHNPKFGENYRRYDVSDHNFFFNTPAVYFGYTNNGLQNFANGIAYQYRGSLNVASDVPIAMWGLGVYAQDEWNVLPHLKLTLAMRAEHNSNPVCQINCFANFKGPVSSLASFTSSNPGSVPYSNDIAYGLHQAFQGVDTIDWSPRFGFSWSPGSSNKTVISGGFGIFYDAPPAGLVDDLLANPPNSVAIRVRPAAGTLPFDPAGGPATLAASESAFNISQTYGQISAALTKLGSVFAAPAFTSIQGTVHASEFQEWNLQVQRELSNDVVLALNYVGNHGIKIPYSNAWANAYDLYSIYPGVPGIPANQPVPNYGTVTTVQSGALSNYNGLSVSVSKRFSHWVAGHFNYTWAHGLDEVSNGGIFGYGGESLLGQISPLSLRALNYGNSDYDIRHNFNADFIVTPTYKSGNHFLNAALGGWQLSGKIFWRSGLPFSVTDSNTALGNGGGSLLATYAGNLPKQSACGESSQNIPCLNAGAFLDSSVIPYFTGLSSQNRNQFRGPGYFNMDMAAFKTFKVSERASLGIGVQAFNVLNHPNFGLPDAGLGDALFGIMSGAAPTPTSPYGTYLNFDSSPRVVQLTGKITF